LLLPIERAGVRQHLHPDVAVVTVGVGQRARRELVHERGSVLTKQRDVGDAFDVHQRATTSTSIRPTK
jgi:hypothetical protein